VRLSTVLAAAAVLASGASAAADVTASGVSLVSDRERLEREPPSGVAAMMASAVYPGLGQLLNGAEPKSAVVSAVEAVLVAGLLVEDRRTRNSFRLYEQTGDSGYYDEYSEHYDRRQTLMWWVAIAALYGLTDAYVDAHLADFNSLPVMGSEWTLDAGGGALRVGLAFRY